MPLKGVIWKDSERERCIQLYMNGVTAREIGKCLSRSKNSVIGFLNRSGYTKPKVNKPKAEVLPKPKEPVKSTPVIRINPVTKGESMSKPEPIPSKDTVSLIKRDMTYQCGWIVGEVNGSKSRCCGKLIYKKSFCEEHHNIVYERRIITDNKPKREFVMANWGK